MTERVSTRNNKNRLRFSTMFLQTVEDHRRLVYRGSQLLALVSFTILEAGSLFMAELFRV